MREPLFARRTFLKAAAAGAAGAAIGGSLGAPRAARAEAQPPSDGGPIKLGVASYSLRNFPREKAIEMVKALRTPYVNIKSVHADYALSPAELAAARAEFEAAGLQVVGGGTITFGEDTDADVQRYFAYARQAGMPLIVATCAPAVLPRVERFAKRYDVRVAIHNHGPEDPHYPSPHDVLRHVRDMDPRMGLCIDVGHTVRTSTDVVQAIADAGPRLHDLHAKDLTDLTRRDSQVAVGEGKIPIAGIFRALQTIRFPGYVNLEYEINAKDPLPGMQISFAHMRGVLAGLAEGSAAAPAKGSAKART